MNPQLIAYLTQILNEIEHQLSVNNIQLINLIICTALDRLILEKFVFEIQKSTFPNVEVCPVQAFRSCLLKVCFCDAVLDPLPDDKELTFFITVKLAESKGRNADRIGAFPWHQMEPLDEKLNSLTVPLKSVMLGDCCKFQLYVQEMGENKKLFGICNQ